MIESHFYHKCDIQRQFSGGEVNAHGLETDNFQPHVSGVPCRYSEKEERRLNAENAEDVIFTVSTLLLPHDTDIQERDRIAGIVLENGTLLDKIFIVKKLYKRRGRHVTHISAALELDT